MCGHVAAPQVQADGARQNDYRCKDKSNWAEAHRLRHSLIYSGVRPWPHATAHGDQSGCGPSLVFCKTLPVIASTPTSQVILPFLISKE
jgi:hypothetical protein